MTSGPNIFQSKPASSIFIFPFITLHKCSAIPDEPVNYNNLKFDLLNNFSIWGPSQWIKSQSFGGNPAKCNNRKNISNTIETL